MSLKDAGEMTPRTLINSQTVASSIEYFFARGELSQVVDQTNPLAQLTHERRLSALGPGGLNRKRAGFEVREPPPFRAPSRRILGAGHIPGAGRREPTPSRWRPFPPLARCAAPPSPGTKKRCGHEKQLKNLRLLCPHPCMALSGPVSPGLLRPRRRRRAPAA